MRTSRPRQSSCPIDHLLRQISGPWTTYILWLLLNEGVLRFGQIKARMPDVSPKMLTERLRQLEDYGLVHRDYEASIPPKVSYSLTPRGLELKVMLINLGEIAARWAAEDAGKEATAEALASRIPA